MAMMFIGKNRRRERGSSLIESALIMLGLLMLLIGIMDFSRALYTFHIISDAARQGTRYAIVRGSECKTPGPCTASDVEAHLKSILPGIDPASLTVTTTWTPDNHPGSTVKVEASYPFHFVLPLGTITMHSTSVMVISQ